MRNTLRVAIFGTFDVENYGDLLFPYIAQHELSQRLGNVEVLPFSYNGKSKGEWPYEVYSLTTLDQHIQKLDAMLIGGGHLIRFDSQVADAYLPPPSVPHPLGYWLTPALAGAIAGVPVIWNAPGSSDVVPSWAAPVLDEILSVSSYASVRDDFSYNALARAGVVRLPNVVPDTAFGLADVFGRDDTDPVSTLLRNAGIDRPYVVVQPVVSLIGVAHEIGAKLPDGVQILSLPIGPVLGDDDAVLQGVVDSFHALKVWPSPPQIAEIVRRSIGVVAQSLHLTVTAISYGRPALRRADHMGGKYAALGSSDAVRTFVSGDDSAIKWVLGWSEKLHPDALHNSKLTVLTRHWDAISKTIRDQTRPSRGPYALANCLIAATQAPRAALEEVNRQLAIAGREFDTSDDLGPLGEARLISSGWFDPRYYARLAGLSGSSNSELIHHYLQHGELAGHRPSEGFDPGHYRASNPDLEHWPRTLLEHFVFFGEAERRQPRLNQPQR